MSAPWSSSALVPTPETRLRDVAAVSKSLIRAMQCETHFAMHYLVEGSPLKLIDSPLARTGTDFHAYRAAYVSHLLEIGAPADKDWARRWLQDTAVVTDDARALITDDIDTYGINPDTIFAAELFLSITAAGEPVEMEIGGAAPGRVTSDVRAVASGSIDLLEIDGATATVVDYKSGWATATVSDFEPPVYGALVLAHFPQVERVNFRWEFVRLGTEKAYSYSREQMPELLDMIVAALTRAKAIAARFPLGQLSVNPWAGLCGYCALRCPLRDAATSRQLMIPPVQSEDDARQAAAILYAARTVAARATDALRPWLATRGQMPLNADFVAEIAVQIANKRPLLDALEILGFDVTSMRGINSPAFDVPIEKLTVGGLSTYARAKKRRGLSERLEKISARSARSVLRIRRLSEGEQLLEAAAEEEPGDAAA
jgi:hypothetical protein